MNTTRPYPGVPETFHARFTACVSKNLWYPGQRDPVPSQKTPSYKGTRQSLRAEDGVSSICCHMLAY